MDKFKEIMGKVLDVLKRAGIVLLDVIRRAWELICKYTPILWAALCRGAKKLWGMLRTWTAGLLGVDENLYSRAVNVTLCLFAVIILLFILTLAT